MSPVSTRPRRWGLGAATGLLALAPLLGQPAPAQAAVSPDPAAARTSAATSSPRWSLEFVDHFNGSQLNTSLWSKYTGGFRRADNLIVRNGKLRLRTKKTSNGWTAAGVSSSRASKQTYGRYTIRARLERGWGTRAVALLWPTGGVWPPEVDFFEMSANDPDRRINRMTNHYTPGHQMNVKSVRADFTRWHKIRVVWKPGKLVYRLDGRRVARMTHHVPARDMWLGLQTAPGGQTAQPDERTPNTVDWIVDWVRVESLN